MSSQLLICPGVHDPALTQEFLAGIAIAPTDTQILSTTEPYSPLAVLAFLKRSLPSPSETPPLRIIAFSAGVVGAIGAAHLWQNQGGCIQWMIVLDGWGVPAWASFPVYRLSHDGFTHWSSKLLGGFSLAFYADPPVEHLDLWRSPQQAVGWRSHGCGLHSRTTAAMFIQEILTGRPESTSAMPISSDLKVSR